MEKENEKDYCEVCEDEEIDMDEPVDALEQLETEPKVKDTETWDEIDEGDLEI